ncbi:small archaeal modifier protein 2 [Halobacteriales archaeon SW_7_71_33]|nr:MAG: small archaeal modifier protein 2 [Halobacteriales archaeon SW_7_71_33]
MRVTVEAAGEDTHEVDPSEGPTYADLAWAVDLRPREAPVLVGGSPVSEDQPVEPVGAGEVRVLRLVRGEGG